MYIIIKVIKLFSIIYRSVEDLFVPMCLQRNSASCQLLHKTTFECLEVMAHRLKQNQFEIVTGATCTHVCGTNLFLCTSMTCVGEGDNVLDQPIEVLSAQKEQFANALFGVCQLLPNSGLYIELFINKYRSIKILTVILVLGYVAQLLKSSVAHPLLRGPYSTKQCAPSHPMSLKQPIISVGPGLKINCIKLSMSIHYYAIWDFFLLSNDN